MPMTTTPRSHQVLGLGGAAGRRPVLAVFSVRNQAPGLLVDYPAGTRFAGTVRGFEEHLGQFRIKVAAWRCALCGSSLGVGDRFCGDCGAPASGCRRAVRPRHSSPALLPRLRPRHRIPAAARHRGCRLRWTRGVFRAGDGPVAERRVCSVLFCDLAGFYPVVGVRDSRRCGDRVPVVRVGATWPPVRRGRGEVHR